MNLDVATACPLGKAGPYSVSGAESGMYVANSLCARWSHEGSPYTARTWVEDPLEEASTDTGSQEEAPVER